MAHAPAGQFRPWGLLDWTLARSPSIKWDLIGCLGTEQRSLATWQQLCAGDAVDRYRLYKINDKPSRYRVLADERFKERLAEFTRAGGDLKNVQEHDLLETHSDIIEPINEFAKVSTAGVVLDITSLPKRFFFPILKRILQQPQIANLLVTYTRPSSYTQDKLGENFEDWAHLPTFTGKYARGAAEMLIVNVGFAPMGLAGELGQGEHGLPIKLLFPFPAPMGAVRRAWGFVQNLMKGRDPRLFSLYRTDSKDMSSAFDRLVSLTAHGRSRAQLAPFGPKPISAAMCLFAFLTDSEVFYTQPTIYHPDYSLGVSLVNGIPETYTYWIRLKGQDLYRL